MPKRVAPDEAEPRLTLFQLESEGLAVLSFPIAPRSSPDCLTPAERSIAEAILQGKSNVEIGRQRGTSPRTVANQVAALFEKLGVRSRSELAGRLAQPVGRAR